MVAEEAEPAQPMDTGGYFDGRAMMMDEEAPVDQEGDHGGEPWDEHGLLGADVEDDEDDFSSVNSDGVESDDERLGELIGVGGVGDVVVEGPQSFWSLPAHTGQEVGRPAGGQEVGRPQAVGGQEVGSSSGGNPLTKTAMDRLQAENLRLSRELEDTRAQLSVAVGDRMRPMGGGEENDDADRPEADLAEEGGAAATTTTTSSSSTGSASSGATGSNSSPAAIRLSAGEGASEREQQQAAMVERGLQAYLEDGARRWGSLEKYVRAIDRHVAKFPKIGVELTLANQRRLDAEMRMNEALLSLGEAKTARGALVSRAVSAERNVAVLQRRVDELERGGVVGRVVERQQQAADHHTNYSDLVARMQKAESTIQELRKTVKKLVRSRDAAIREVDELRALGEEYIQEREMLDKVTAEAIEAYTAVGEASERDAVIEELEGKLAELQADNHHRGEGGSVSSSLASAVEVTRERDEARASVATLTQELEAVKRSLTATTQELETVKTTLAATTQERNAANLSLATARASQATTRRECDAALAAVAAAEGDTTVIVRQKEQLHGLAMARAEQASRARIAELEQRLLVAEAGGSSAPVVAAVVVSGAGRGGGGRGARRGGGGGRNGGV